MKKRSVVFCIIMAVSIQAFALTNNEIAMFKKLQKKWEQKEEKLFKQRSRVKASDPRYTKITKEIIKAGYWADYYKEAQTDKSTTWYIITNTIVWSAQDLQETASIMWNNSENLLEKAYTGKWTDLLKDSADSLMRQKIRKMMRRTFQGKTYPDIEDYIFTKFISPQLNKSKMDEYAEQSFGKAKDKLKDAYVDEVKRQAKSRSKADLEKYGKEIAGRVGGAVDAAEFTIDMVQKYIMWDEAQPTIENMLASIQKISKREKCSHIKAFNIYLGKEKMTENAADSGKQKFDPANPPEYYVDPAVYKPSTSSYKWDKLFSRAIPSGAVKDKNSSERYYALNIDDKMCAWIYKGRSISTWDLKAPFEKNTVFEISQYLFYSNLSIQTAQHIAYDKNLSIKKEFTEDGKISQYMIVHLRKEGNDHSVAYAVVFTFDSNGKIVSEKIYSVMTQVVTVNFKTDTGKAETVTKHKPGSMPGLQFAIEDK